MWLTTLAIKRPLIVLIGIGALIAFGMLAWTRVGVELLPAIDIPLVNVTTVYPGAGPDAVDTLVTTRVEDAVASLSDIDSIEATSVDGLSSVTILFTDKASKTSAQDVERRVNAIRSDLPTDAKAPTIDSYDQNARPILGLALGGDLGLTQLQQVAEDTLKKDLEAIGGVARVSVVGGMEREIQIQVDPRKLEAHGLSILQVMQALTADNLTVPAGNVVQRDKDWTIRFNSQAQSVAFNNVINGGYDTAAVLTDVGTGATLPGTPVNARYTFTFVGVDSATKKPFSGSGTIYMDVFFNGSKRHPATIYVLYAGSVSVTE